MDDEGILVAALRSDTERAPVFRAVAPGLVLTADVRHPVRGPEPSEGIRDPDQILGELEVVVLSHRQLHARSQQSGRRCNGPCSSLR